MTAPDSRDSSGYRRATAAAVILLSSLWLLVPWRPFDFGSPVEYSWITALHYAFSHQWSFTRDVIFTYGPWGFLYGSYDPGTRTLFLAGWILIATTVALAVWSGTRGRLPAALSWVAIAGWLHLGPPDVPMLLLPALLLIAYQDAGRATLAIVLLTVSVALVSLVKFTFFMAAAVVVLGTLVEDLRKRRLPAIAIAFTAAVLVFWSAGHQALAEFPQFLRNSIMIASGYSEAMSLPPLSNVPSVIPVLVSVALLIALSIPRGIIYAFSLTAILFIFLKTSFVRHDDHALIVAVALPVLYLPVLRDAIRSRVRMRLAVPCAGAVLSLWCLSQTLLTFNGAGLMSSLASLPATWSRNTPFHESHLGRSFVERRSAIAALYPLPARSGSVDSYPGFCSILLANGLTYSPRPGLQSYVAAYSRELLRAGQRHLQSSRAAHTLFLDLHGADQWFPTLQDSTSWPELLTRYRVSDMSSTFLELTRREVPAAYRLKRLQSFRGRFGSPISVVNAEGPVWATITVHRKPPAGVLLMLTRAPVIGFDVELASGTPKHYRLLPAAAAEGFLLSPVVRDWTRFAELADIRWRDRLAGERLVRFTVSSREPQTERFYEPVFDVNLYSLEFEHQNLDGLPGAGSLAARRATMRKATLDKWP